MVDKSTEARIAYYARKATEYGARRFDYLRGRSAKKPPRSRHNRLTAYNAALSRRVFEEYRRAQSEQ